MRFGPLISRRAISRMLRRATLSVIARPVRILFREDGFSQLPLAALIHPEVRRAELVCQRHEIVPIHYRLLKLLGCLRELLLGYRQIAEDFIGEAFGKLTVEALD